MPLACPSCERTITLRDLRPGSFRVPCPSCGATIPIRVDERLSVSAITDPPDEETANHPLVDALRDLPRSLRTLAGLAWRLVFDRSGVVGGAVLVREVGRTSRGLIAEGRQVVAGRDVTIRILAADWAGGTAVDAARDRRFAHVAGEVVHPNLARRFAFGEDRGRRFALEAPLGPANLAALRARPEGLAELDPVAHALQAARGLEAAHRLGIAHGEPGLEHLWLGDDGVVRLDGLGLGSVCGESNEATATARDLPRDVQDFGESLRSLSTDRRLLESAERLRWSGTADGARGLDEVIAELERSASARIEPGEIARWRAASESWNLAPLTRWRPGLLVGWFGLLLAWFAVAARGGRIGGVVAALGLALSSAIGLAWIRSLLGPIVGGYDGLIGSTRAWVAGAKRGDVLVGLGVGLAGWVSLWLAGWVPGAIGLMLLGLVVSAGFAAGIEIPLAASRRGSDEAIREIVASWRSRGVDEVAIRRAARDEGGPGWTGPFEAIFGLEEAILAGRAGGSRSIPLAIRGVVFDWLDARIRFRQEATARGEIERFEEAALVSRKVQEMTARRKAWRIAEAVIVVGREARVRSLAEVWGRSEGSPGVVPRPIPELLREAVESPDRLLTSTWSDARESGPSPNVALGLALRLASILFGPRARFLVGGLLLAGGVLWAERAGVVSLAEVRDRAGEAIAGRDVAPLGTVKVDLERARVADAPLVVEGIPPMLTRPIAGPGSIAAGVILVISSFVAGWRVLPLAWIGAAVSLGGTRLGMPDVGPVPPEGVASAAGAAFVLVGMIWSRISART